MTKPWPPPKKTDLYRSLLGRPEREMRADVVRQWREYKTILITGAGGSIGSELARTIAALPVEPEDSSRLLLMDRSEPALTKIARELPDARPLLADCSDRNVGNVFQELRPDIVLHCAAHKHVPLLQQSPDEAVRNNYRAARNCADAARSCGVGTFVLVSTDKACQPISTMGLTKALCEHYVRWCASKCSPRHANKYVGTIGPPKGKTAFCIVRFGNVLGSDGSVIPIWEEQLAKKEPLAVTDQSMARYLMTLGEAAGLVLEAGAMCEGGETFVLSMGEPVPLWWLLNNFLEVASPDCPQATTNIGPRPGEKQCETLTNENEKLVPTGVEGIQRVEIL